MKTAEEFVETIALCSWHHRKQQIESRDAEIHALYAPVVEAVENDHVLVCQAVTLLNNGETHRAHALLRQWLADWDIRTALAAIKEIQNA